MVSVCQLCMRDGDKLGELIVIDAKTVHVACLIFSSHVWINPRSNPIKDVETLDALRSLTSDMNSSLDYNMPYDKCCSFIMGFDKVVKTTPLCNLCSISGASIKCSVLDCERSFHLPCLIAYNRKVDQSYFIFHAKMVYYPGDNILRPGPFLLCKHHKAWDTDTIWSSLKSYILGRTDLRDSISIDVDTLPLNMQKAALKASSISIFNPEEDKYQIIDENMRTFQFKNLNGAILDIPRGNYISWNFDWEVLISTWSIVFKSVFSFNKGLITVIVLIVFTSSISIDYYFFTLIRLREETLHRRYLYDPHNYITICETTKKVRSVWITLPPLPLPLYRLLSLHLNWIRSKTEKGQYKRKGHH